MSTRNAIAVSWCAIGVHVEIALPDGAVITLHLSPDETDEFCNLLHAAGANMRAMAMASPELRQSQAGTA
jgi:hypothetical protein